MHLFIYLYLSNTINAIIENCRQSNCGLWAEYIILSCIYNLSVNICNYYFFNKRISKDWNPEPPVTSIESNYDNSSNILGTSQEIKPYKRANFGLPNVI